MKILRCIIVSWLAIVVPGIAYAAEESPDRRFTTLFVGFGPGGGYDLYARTLAEHLGKYLPGNPPVVVKNMAGAGSLRLANYLYNVAPKDGSEIGIVARSVPITPLLDIAGVETRYEAVTFSWIGALNARANSLCVSWHTSGVRSFADLRERELPIGATGYASDSAAFARALGRILGFKFKIVIGYRGTNDIALAMERGEVSGMCGWSASSLLAIKRDLVEKGKILPLIQFGKERNRQLPDVPLAIDLAPDENDVKVLELIQASLFFGRPFVAPPGIPPAQLQKLREAFSAAVRDPAFLAQAKERKLIVDSLSGSEIEHELRRLYGLPGTLVERAKQTLQ